MIEQWSRPSQCIRLGGYEETEVSEMSIGIGDDSIEDEHISQRIYILWSERFAAALFPLAKNEKEF